MYRLQRRVVLPRPLEEVFPFFAEPRNLARITPSWLGFRVLTEGELVMRQGLEISYRIRPLGIPQRWCSRISVWEPPRRFVDEQLRGPYRTWHHLHEFVEVPGGTEIRDEVTYELPMGPLGRLAHRLVVRRQLESIFSFRERAVRHLLAGQAAGVEPAARQGGNP